MEEPQSTIDIVISDSQPIFREGLRKLLEAEPGLRIVGEAADGEETVRIVGKLKPKILLLDFSLLEVTGIETLRELATLRIQTRTIIVTTAIEKKQVIELVELGAHGVVLRDSALQLLLKSIRCVSNGQYWIGQESFSDVIHALGRMTADERTSAANRDFGISTREMEVVTHVVAGYTNKDLGRKLGISEQTVKHHLTNIFEKLGVSNRLELVLFAVDHGWIHKD
jgi:DNA-binding NarL/FixJ family response regulator